MRALVGVGPRFRLADDGRDRENLLAVVRTVINAGQHDLFSIFGRLDQLFDVLCREKHVVTGGKPGGLRTIEGDGQGASGGALGVAIDFDALVAGRGDVEAEIDALGVFIGAGAGFRDLSVTLLGLHVDDLAQRLGVAFAGRGKVIGDATTGAGRGLGSLALDEMEVVDRLVAGELRRRGVADAGSGGGKPAGSEKSQGDQESKMPHVPRRSK